MRLDLINSEFYNTYADSFDKIPFEEILIPLIEKHVTQERVRILEIGSGAGALAFWLKNHGHHLTCIEPAKTPAERAREKGLTVEVTRLQDFKSKQKFDCIFAISSLIHIPQIDIPAQIKKIHDSMNPEGVAIVTFIEGVGEGLEDPTEKGKYRFFSKYSEKELRMLLEPYFTTIEFHRIEVKKMKQTFILLVLMPKA